MFIVLIFTTLVSIRQPVDLPYLAVAVPFPSLLTLPIDGPSTNVGTCHIGGIIPRSLMFRELESTRPTAKIKYHAWTQHFPNVSDVCLIEMNCASIPINPN